MTALRFLSAALLALVFLNSHTATAQDTGKGHRIIIGFTQNDSMQMKALLNQLSNITQEWPEAEIEVVCYNQGLDLLLRSNTQYAGKLEELSKKGVRFVACENTLLKRKMHHDQIIGLASWVKAGIIEIALKQEQGWSYIVGGF